MILSVVIIFTPGRPFDRTRGGRMDYILLLVLILLVLVLFGQTKKFTRYLFVTFPASPLLLRLLTLLPRLRSASPACARERASSCPCSFPLSMSYMRALSRQSRFILTTLTTPHDPHDPSRPLCCRGLIPKTTDARYVCLHVCACLLGNPRGIHI